MCAASLTEMTTEIAGGVAVQPVLQSGGSQTLLAQYKAGAPTDLLLLADAKLVDSLPADKPSKTAVFASNQLVVARPEGRPYRPGSLSSPETTLLLADPQAAPLGRYSEQALSELKVEARRVYLKDATAVMAALQLGHGDLGVVYTSDLARWQGIEGVPEIKLGKHDTIAYAAVLPLPAHPEAERLYRKLTGPESHSVLRQFGLSPLVGNSE